MTTTEPISAASPQPPEITLCLCDNDWLIKIAVWDLIREALKVLKVPRANVRVLASCERVVCSRAKGNKYGEMMVERVREFLRHVTVIGDGEIDDMLVEKVFTPGKIDGGEAQFFAASLPHDYYIATDDKKSLVELAARADLDEVYQRNCGRVVCVEQVLVRILEVHGYEAVDGRIRPYCHADDNVLQAWAGGRGQSPKDTLAVLRGHVDELRKRTHDLLAIL